MTNKICAGCGQPFEPRPQVPDQAYCSEPDCQRARKRQWQRAKRLGGVPPLGYDVENRLLVINEAEAAVVRRIFEEMLTIGSPTQIAANLTAEGITTKAWTTQEGVTRAGARIDKKYLHKLLRNRIYLGELSHKGTWYPGAHPAIIDHGLWGKVHDGDASLGRCVGAALPDRAPPHREPDGRARRSRPRWLESELARAGLEGADRRVCPGQHRRRTGRDGGAMKACDSLQTFVPLVFKRRGIQRLADTGAVAHDPTIIEAMARAFHWQHLLDSGSFENGTAIARAEGLHHSTVNELLRLTLLAPDIVEQLLAGRQPRRLTLIWFQRNPIPVDWQQQRQIIQSFE